MLYNLNFSERLKQLRNEKKITQEDLAAALDIPPSTIRRLETASEGLPRKERLEAIADYFDVSVDYLLGRTDQRQKDAVDKLIEYLDLELTDEEIMERMTFKIDNLTLTPEEVKEFIAFVRAKRFMKSGRGAYPGTSLEP